MSTLENRDKYAWFIGENRLGLVEKKTAGVGDPTWVSPTSAGKGLRIFYIARPLKLTDDLTTSPEIPEQFHESLVYKVIADMYRLPGDSLNLELAAYFDQMYMAQVREGKKYASRNKVSGGFIKPVSF
tara:strand:- start:1793 stop:2176 length:384 start_codon:yes stop_codon:yes gene_type:complete